MLQERFVRESLSRMQRLVKEKLVTGMVQTPSTPVTNGTGDSVSNEKLEDTSGLKR
jgi:hypothetical protein